MQYDLSLPESRRAPVMTVLPILWFFAPTLTFMMGRATLLELLSQALWSEVSVDESFPSSSVCSVRIHLKGPSLESKEVTKVVASPPVGRRAFAPGVVPLVDGRGGIMAFNGLCLSFLGAGVKGASFMETTSVRPLLAP